jgi:hypothetical protein
VIALLKGQSNEEFLLQKTKKAIQITLKGFNQVVASGLEPETYYLEGSCSIQLSYATIANCFAAANMHKIEKSKKSICFN